MRHWARPLRQKMKHSCGASVEERYGEGSERGSMRAEGIAGDGWWPQRVKSTARCRWEFVNSYLRRKQ
ncbi:hypothetical protein ACFX13_025001 [Malus domestica]